MAHLARLRTHRLWFSVLAAALGGLVTGVALADGEDGVTTVPYEGFLMGPDGAPLDGTVPMAFEFFANAGGSGTPLCSWTHGMVAVHGGRFRVSIGSTDTGASGSCGDLAGLFASNEAVWMRITLSPPGEDPQTLEPLIPIGTVPRALHARVATHADLAAAASDAAGTLRTELNGLGQRLDGVEADRMPAGTVIFWYRASAGIPVPDGYAICDGSRITAPGSPLDGRNAPNLVGRFPRGSTLAQLGETGGTDTVNLAHTHTYSNTSGGGGEHSHIAPGGISLGGPMAVSNFRPFGTAVVSGNVSMCEVTAGVGCDTVSNPGMSKTSTEPTHTHTVSGTTASGGASLDNRPAYVGLLPLIRL